jgi:phosphonate metabolism protein PhnN/1,5-bisphosphokinase (PRPP-forming)
LNDTDFQCDAPTRKAISAGALALVVGPSGAGKDTLMAAAKAALAGDERIVFARRIVTRPSHEATESHDVMSTPEFERAEQAGQFLLSWRAHGLGYAIPGSIRAELEACKVVIANVSRTSIRAAEDKVDTVVVLHVTAPLAVLAQRIARRGREPVEAIAARLAREAQVTAARSAIVEVVNDGGVEEATRLFTDVLRAIAEQSTRRAG